MTRRLSDRLRMQSNNAACRDAADVLEPLEEFCDLHGVTIADVVRYMHQVADSPTGHLVLEAMWRQQ